MSFYFHISESPDPLDFATLCGKKIEEEVVPHYVEIAVDRICPACREKWLARSEPGRTYVCLLFPAALMGKKESLEQEG